jgi:alanyl-tRNA synthetase
MLIKDGIVPGNKQQGYVLRRLIRRAIFHEQELFNKTNDSALSLLAEGLQEKYPELQESWSKTTKVLDDEYTRFNKLLQEGKSRLTKVLEKGISIDGKLAFDLYQTNGFPLELTTEILESNGRALTKGEKNQFAEEFRKHQELSRTASAGVFKGGLADHSEIVTRYHTATHLLQAALRKILGEDVRQKGSNLTVDRLRFDFSYFKKLADEQVSKVENIINEQIEKNLPVEFETTNLTEAIKNGALTVPGEKYPEKVRVYSINNFSKEVCGGPHASTTGVLGRFKIIKEESAGSNTRRIYAVLENKK